jgi:phosphate:Na+ symporter
MELLINIAGGVALLIWGVRMVRTGLNRALGSSLRRLVSTSTGNRVSAFCVGLGVTGLLQSSTATALVAASFAGRGLLTTSMGIALMLGADVGSTLIVQALSFDVSWLSPALLVIGVLLFMNSEHSAKRALARAAIGLGLILLSLTLISTASAPLRETESFTIVLRSLTDEMILAVLAMAAMTWAAHSSVAIVLLVMSLVAVQAVSIQLGMAMVLGANLGSAITAFVATSRSSPAARRIPLGNLIARAAGIAGGLYCLPYVQPYLSLLDSEPERLIANFHTLFNLALALAFLPLVGPVAALTTRLLPDAAVDEDPGQPRYLDQDALETPSIALAAASRETLRMGDEVRAMLERTKEVFASNDAALMREVEEQDDVIDSLHEAVKLYLTGLAQKELDEKESRRSIEILSFTTNLEHIGDVIDKNLMELANKKIKHKLAFSNEGERELVEFHDRVIANLNLALNIFMTPDRALARRLLKEKSEVRNMEQDLIERHFERVGAGRVESISSSALHLDILRDLKRINSHLTSVAYPILERHGELSESRLLDIEPGS